jgi:hypothetical protein
MEARMRRFTILLALPVILVAACDESPVDPPAAVPAALSASVQQDSVPPASEPDSSTMTTSGGILIGSGS